VATPELEAPAAGANRIEVPIKKATGPGDDKIHVWPHLVRAEFLIAIAMVLLLMVWSLLVDAPLEEPANPTRTPNPSKAPWYFLGLQEMLVFFDPWHAGVVLPSFIILGLMVIPYIDINPKGNGYYCFKDRKWEILTYIVGFHVLWVSLIIIGTFLRGPNWNFFGPYEYWDLHRVEPLLNVNVSDFFWVKLLGRPLPSNPLVREFWGVLAVVFYLFALPVLLARPFDKAPRWLRWMSLNKYYEKMGPPRYYVGVLLFLLMLSLPIKMYLRWAFNLKYIVAFPGILFNI